ncbi:acyltransferase [Hydrogenophaga sp. D2P1]|uniref:Acyltransferase n=1 Tax=Hydrogenophaga aromaticivorans TaxID=2610898 RepID=A0A7Y8KW85_9BURK|nr:acyltransferase [Hydrogenophaga aromaticivorans]NWF44262.1 acyltransferase [Hydrogenophaga aromaticivorans]
MRNFVSIESLRAYMAWWVVIGHASHLGGWSSYIPKPIVALIERGDIAVNVFIIVSGFVITHLIQASKESYAPYLTRRFFRIFPIYFACFLLAIAIHDLYQAAYFHPWVFGVEMREARANEESLNFLTHFGLHLTLLHGLIPDTLIPFASSTFLAPAWSLSLEWQFYLVAPAILYMLRRSTGISIAFVIICLALNQLAKSGQFGTWAYASFLPLSIHYFLIGIISRLILEEVFLHDFRAESLIILSALVATISGPLEAAIWSIFFTLILSEMNIVNISNPFLKHAAQIFVLNYRVARAGSWSYSTYLLHIPIFSIAVGAPTLLYSDISQTTVNIIVLLSFPVIIFASRTTFKLIEQPFNSIGRRFAKRMTASNQAEASC